jgi:hypothetical protein
MGFDRDRLSPIRGRPFRSSDEALAMQNKFLLDESKLPKAWYNINPDLPVPPA